MDRLRLAFAALVAAFFAFMTSPSFALDGEFPASVPRTTHDPVRLVALDDRTPGPWYARARESADFRTIMSWNDYMAKSCAMTASLASSGYASMLTGWDCSDPIANWPNPVKGAVIAVPTEPTLVFVPSASASEEGAPMAMVTIPEVAAGLSIIDQAIKETQAISAAVEAQAPAQAPNEPPAATIGVITILVLAAMFGMILYVGRQHRGVEGTGVSPILSSGSSELDEMHMRYVALRDAMIAARSILEESPREVRPLADMCSDAHRVLSGALAADTEEGEQREATSKNSDNIAPSWDLPSAGIS